MWAKRSYYKTKLTLRKKWGVLDYTIYLKLYSCLNVLIPKKHKLNEFMQYVNYDSSHRLAAIKRYFRTYRNINLETEYMTVEKLKWQKIIVKSSWINSNKSAEWKMYIFSLWYSVYVLKNIIEEIMKIHKKCIWYEHLVLYKSIEEAIIECGWV